MNSEQPENGLEPESPPATKAENSPNSASNVTEPVNVQPTAGAHKDTKAAAESRQVSQARPKNSWVAVIALLVSLIALAGSGWSMAGNSVASISRWW